MTRLVDTTVRLLSQQPLAGAISTARVLEVAELLDGAGFAALEVSGGGCFDAAVKRAAESPWERIRALRARCSKTPLQMALRGRFLVGSRPVSDDLTRRFILCAAESGIDIFRLHDPLNDVENLAASAAAVREAGGRLYAGLAFSGHMANLERVVEKAKRLADLGADHVLLHDPAGALDPGTCGQVVARLAEESGVPVGLYCQGTGGNALAMAIEAARNGAEPIATAAYPVATTLNRVSSELLCAALSGLDLEHGVDTDAAWEASRFIDEHVTSQLPAHPVPPRITLRTALNRVPVGLVAELDARLRRADAADRLDEVLAELRQVREDCGTPPLAPPIGGILAGQAVSTYSRPAAGVRSPTRCARWCRAATAAPAAARGRRGGARRPRRRAAGARHGGAPLRGRRQRGGPAAPGALRRRRRRLLENLRGRGRRDERPESLEPEQSERIRELIGLVEASEDVGELTLEDGSIRITVRRQDEHAPPLHAVPAPAQPADNGAVPEPAVSELHKIESPMVGTFYRASIAQPASVRGGGDRVEVGQTLGILEAMKLFNELKSDHAGVVRRILVANAEPVEYGQPLFEFEPG